MNKALIVSCIVLFLLTASVAKGDYYYYGAAANGVLSDNDILWAALEPYPEWDLARALLRDNWDADDGNRSDGYDSTYDDLLWFANNLQPNDVFLFAYMGHGGWSAPDNYHPDDPDEGSTARPATNDPTPDNYPPYELDEFFGYTGSTYYLYDDDLTQIFSYFDPGVQVVVVSGACHAGGWIGGSQDLDNSAPAHNNGLYGIFAAPEHGLSLAVGEILLTEALSNTLEPYMTMANWYDAAMDYGEARQYWPAADWVPSFHEETWYSDSPGYWGWEQTYLQLRPVAYATLDTGHDHLMCTPEPTTTSLLALGLVGIGARLRRRKAR